MNTKSVLIKLQNVISVIFTHNRNYDTKKLIILSTTELQIVQKYKSSCVDFMASNRAL